MSQVANAFLEFGGAGSSNVGECGRLSQLIWLLAHYNIVILSYLLKTTRHNSKYKYRPIHEPADKMLTLIYEVSIFSTTFPYKQRGVIRYDIFSLALL